MIELWTDGSAGPTNPGPGGWAVVGRTGAISVGFSQLSTNIRMEGFAIVEALRYAAGREVVIRTDSQFWVNVLTDWGPRWSRNGWRKSDGSEPENLDLVKEGLARYEETADKTTLQWVRGHNGDPGNEMADYWATQARIQQLRFWTTS